MLAQSDNVLFLTMLKCLICIGNILVMNRTITMSIKELDRLEVIKQRIYKTLSLKSAAKKSLK